ncbi:MAG: hypothetical protein D6806_18865 [Deltaproteobacteria bacterium]|nr:MAG: hypothetical protein D6806_18865 [Deltaproteobacteria bacterium]
MAGLGMYYMFGAFRGLEHLGPFESFTVLSLLCVGLMIPAGPGMVGNFHYFVKLGLGLFLPAQLLATDAMAYAVVLHAMQLGQQTLWGLFFVVTGRIGLSRLLPEGRAELGESSCTDS